MFNKAGQGALKKAMGGSIRRAVGRAAGQSVPAASTSTATKGGALGRLTRIAPQSQKNPRSQRGHHMMPASDTLSKTDSTLAETGEGLRQIVGKMSRGRIAASKGGPIRRGSPRRNDKGSADSLEYSPLIDDPARASRRKSNQRYRVRHGDQGVKDLIEFDKKRSAYAEGGKVGTAMTALRALAKKYQAALESGDMVLARRLKKQLDSEGVKDPEEAVGNQKAATFAKGGKVKGLRRLAKIFRARMDDREGYIREGFGATREEAHENLRKEVAADNGEDTVDALMREHGVTYKRSKE
jgi:hypothetical protein